MAQLRIEGPSDSVAMETKNVHSGDEEWIRALVFDDEELIRRIIEDTPSESRPSKLLNNLLDLKALNKDCHGSAKRICNTSYSPDIPLCLSAIYNSRRAIAILAEYGANYLQKTSYGNNMLHTLVAFASTGGDDGEEVALSTIKYLKDLLGDKLYWQLLEAENNDGLRPLELACHLGTFGISMYFFETPGLYITHEEDHILYKMQYFDITDYVSGPRYLKSPIYAMTYIDEDKLASRYSKDAYLNDPISSWISTLLRINMPCIVLWFIYRVLYIMLFLTCDSLIQDDCNDNGKCRRRTKLSVNVNLGMYFAIFVMSALMIICDIIDFVHWLCFHPRWLNKNVYGTKPINMHHLFYRLSHFSAVLIATVSSAVALACHFENISPYPAMEIAVIIGVWSFVWSVLYFIQLIPMLGYYVMSIQRMLKDFMNFALMLMFFFFTYTIAFYKLLRTNETVKDFHKIPESIYSVFRLMLNMVDLFNPDAEVGFAVYVVHISFVFMVAILLVNFLIATMTSSYDLVMSSREVLFKIQRLSVSVTVDQRFPRLLTPFRDYMRRRLFVYENGRYYISRMIVLPANPNKWTERIAPVSMNGWFYHIELE